MTDRLIELARRASSGSRRHLEELLQSSVGIVHSLARARLGDTEAAEAATAQALQNIAAGVTTIRDPQAFPAWLQTVTQRAIQKFGAPRSENTLTAEPIAPEAPPIDAMVAAEERRQLQRGLAQLPPDARELVLLHFVDGLTYRELAAFFAVGLGSVVRRMRQALDRLHAELSTTPRGDS